MFISIKITSFLFTSIFLFSLISSFSISFISPFSISFISSFLILLLSHFFFLHPLFSPRQRMKEWICLTTSVSGIQFSSRSFIGRERERRNEREREKIERERKKLREKNFEFFDDIDRVQISLSVFLTIFSSFLPYCSLSLSLTFLSPKRNVILILFKNFLRTEMKGNKTEGTKRMKEREREKVKSIKSAEMVELEEKVEFFRFGIVSSFSFSLSLSRFKVRTFKLLSKNVGRKWRGRKEKVRKKGERRENRIELGFDFWFDSSIKEEWRRRVKESEVLSKSFEG